MEDNMSRQTSNVNNNTMLTILKFLILVSVLPQPCVEKILSVLSNYNHILKRVSGFPSCAESVHRLRPAMHKLHEDINKCVKVRPVMNHHDEVSRLD